MRNEIWVTSADPLGYACDRYTSLRKHIGLKQHRQAENGRSGGSNMNGKSGEPTTIVVPVGTVVKKIPLRRDTGEQVEVLADLEKPGDSVLVARGGKGGKYEARTAHG